MNTAQLETIRTWASFLKTEHGRDHVLALLAEVDRLRAKYGEVDDVPPVPVWQDVDGVWWTMNAHAIFREGEPLPSWPQFPYYLVPSMPDFVRSIVWDRFAPLAHAGTCVDSGRDVRILVDADGRNVYLDAVYCDPWPPPCEWRLTSGSTLGAVAAVRDGVMVAIVMPRRAP